MHFIFYIMFCSKLLLYNDLDGYNAESPPYFQQSDFNRISHRNSRPKIDKDVHFRTATDGSGSSQERCFAFTRNSRSKIDKDVNFWTGGSGGSPAWTQKQRKPVFDREGKTPAQDTGCRNVSAGSSRKPERCPSFYVRVKWWARVLRFAKHRIAFFFLRRPWRKLLIGETFPSK